MIFSWFFLLSNLETVINLGDLILSKLSTLSNDFLSNSSAGSMPGFITIILSSLIPQVTAKFFVYLELAITFSQLFRTFTTRLFILDPFV